MRIGIDVRKLGDGGIGEYVRGTLIALANLPPKELEIVCFGDPARRDALPIDAEWVAVRSPHYSLREHVMLARAVRRANLDLFHAPHYVLPFGLPVESVVTVHDLIHVRLPRTRAHRLYARAMITSACRRARRVIAVSFTTANELDRELGVPVAKIRVIPNGVSERFRPLEPPEVDRELARLGVMRPYVLFVGNWLPHKNVETLVAAWAELAAPRPALVLCGGGFDRADEVWRAVEASGDRARVLLLGAVGTEALVALYNGASFFVTTSLAEGFCLPLVEAFACGTPVLASDAGAIPEVAGGAALLVSPRRVDSIAGGMYRLLTDGDLRQSSIERGFQRAREFRWESAAKQTLAVYEEVRGGAKSV